jgi:uncharacterized RDD family membrane protein YckC
MDGAHFPSEAGPRTSSGPRAGFWQRFAAALVDGIIVGATSAILYIALENAGEALGILLGIAYYVYLEGAEGGPTGQTLGKRALAIRVVDIDTGGPIGYGRALIRYVGRIVSAVVIYLGYLWMLWDGEKQCWHDKFASDVVVPEAWYPIGG